MAPSTPTPPPEGDRLTSPEGVISDRRQASRFNVALSASEHSGPFQLVWTTTDLSTTGLSMRDSFSRPPGARVRLDLDLKDAQRPLHLEAEVVGPFGEEGGVRVRFVGLSEVDRARIEAALELGGRS